MLPPVPLVRKSHRLSSESPDVGSTHPEARIAQSLRTSRDMKNGGYLHMSACKSGWFDSKKNRRRIHYRSSWELAYYESLERDPPTYHSVSFLPFQIGP